MASGGALGRLNVILGLDAAEFTSGMNKAEYQARNSLDKIAKQAKVAAVALSGIGVAVGALASREILKASEAMDAMGKRAQGLGVAVAPLTEISYQAEKAGLGLNELDVGLRRVSRTAYDAARGNDAAVDVFKTMGITVTDTAGNLRSTESLWRDVADWFARTEDSSYKAGVGYKLFGTQVTALTPILNEGSAGLDAAAAKARELGIVFDGEAASAAARLNDSLFDLKKRVDGFWMTVGGQAVPILSDFTEALFESDNSVTTLAGSVQSFASDQALLDWIDFVGAGLAHLTDVLVGLAKLVQAVKGSFDVVFADTAKFSAWVAQDHTGLTEMFDPEKAKQQKAEYERLTRERDQILEDANKKWSDVWNFDGAKFANAWETAMTQARARIGNPFDVDLTNLGAPTSMAPIAVKPPVAGKGPKSDKDPLGTFLKTAEMQDSLRAIEEQAKSLQSVLYSLYPERQIADQFDSQLQTLRTAMQDGQLDAIAYLDAVTRLSDKAFSEPPGVSDLGGSGGLFGTSFEESRLDEQAERIEQWYSDQLAMLEQFRATKADMNAQWDVQEQSLEQQHQDAINSIEMARQNIRMTSTEQMFGGLAGMAKTFAGEQSGLYKGLFAIEKAYAIAKVIMNAPKTASDAYAAMAGIPVVGPALGVAAAAAALSFQVAQVAGIRGTNMAGMAHDGIDRVPETGTWLLQKGERVMTSDTSARLDSVLSRIDRGQGAQQGGLIVNLIENPDRGGEVEESVDDNGDRELRMFVADIHGGGGRSQILERAYGLRRVGM